jgi:DNA repair photolyase
MTDNHNRYGHSGVKHKTSRSILTKVSGFIDAYGYTLNPYNGCAFGCSH